MTAVGWYRSRPGRQVRAVDYSTSWTRSGEGEPEVTLRLSTTAASTSTSPAEKLVVSLSYDEAEAVMRRWREYMDRHPRGSVAGLPPSLPDDGDRWPVQM